MVRPELDVAVTTLPFSVASGRLGDSNANANLLPRNARISHGRPIHTDMAEIGQAGRAMSDIAGVDKVAGTVHGVKRPQQTPVCTTECQSVQKQSGFTYGNYNRLLRVIGPSMGAKRA